jgi:hypothetical protein
MGPIAPEVARRRPALEMFPEAAGEDAQARSTGRMPRA